MRKMAAMTLLTNGHGNQDLLKTLGGINVESFSNDADRSKAVVEVYALLARLETPWESIARLCMGQVNPPSSFPPLF
jgi:hypothetical protein